MILAPKVQKTFRRFFSRLSCRCKSSDETVLGLAARPCASPHQHNQRILLQNTPLADKLRAAVGLSKVETGKVEVISPGMGFLSLG